ncbi:hypothetical protein HK405_011776, partial [Cladochytrium tenue]
QITGPGSWADDDPNIERQLAEVLRELEAIRKTQEDATRTIAKLEKENDQLRQELAKIRDMPVSSTHDTRKMQDNSTNPLGTTAPRQKHSLRYPLSYAAAAATGVHEFPSTFERNLQTIRSSTDTEARKQALRSPPRERMGDTEPRGRAEFVAIAIRPGLSAAARAAGPIHSLRDFFRICSFPPVAEIKPIGRFAMLFECWVDKKHLEKFRECCYGEKIIIDEDFVPWKPSKSKLDCEESVEIAENQYLSRMAGQLTNIRQPIGGSLRQAMLTSVPEHLREHLEARIQKLTRSAAPGIAAGAAAASQGSNGSDIRANTDIDMA